MVDFEIWKKLLFKGYMTWLNHDLRGNNSPTWKALWFTDKLLNFEIEDLSHEDVLFLNESKVDNDRRYAVIPNSTFSPACEIWESRQGV